jgi:hypothetical protein
VQLPVTPGPKSDKIPRYIEGMGERGEERVRKLWVAAFIGLAVASCGLARQREMQERATALNAQSQAAAEACNTTVPAGNPKTAVARARCQMDALEIRRPIVTYPDLMDSFIATRMSVAEQIQNGRLTIAQGTEILANKNSELVSEEQRRNLSKRAVAAQESAAAASWAASGPVSCTKIGNTVNCF